MCLAFGTEMIICLPLSQALANVDYVIEAVRESEDIKRSIFSRLDEVCTTLITIYS